MLTTAYRAFLVLSIILCTSLVFAETETLLTIEDETVVSGLLQNRNFSDLSYNGGLYIGVASDALWTGRSYLKFDLNEVQSPIATAYLWIYLTQKFDDPDRPIGAYLTSDGWSEATLTWNNAPPPAGGPIDTAMPPFAARQWYCWDVTDLVTQEAAGDGTLSILLREIEESTEPCTWNYFAEREYNLSLAPRLTVQYLDSGTTEPPVLVLPEDLTVEQESPQGSEVYFEISATDSSGLPLVPDATPDSGSIFPAGKTTVAVTATDNKGLSTCGSFEVSVVDTTPPVLSLPENMFVAQQSPAGAAVEFAPTATDLVDPDVAVTCDPPAGSLFPVGTTVVTVTATDASGNEAMGSFTVTVLDLTPPTFSLSVIESILWPPNHKMLLAAMVSDVRDNCDPNPQVHITVTSDEPINGIGDGNTGADWEIRQNGGVWEIYLRAERAGPSDGREYLVTVTATDAAGNSASDHVIITCPADAGNGRWKGK